MTPGSPSQTCFYTRGLALQLQKAHLACQLRIYELCVETGSNVQNMECARPFPGRAGLLRLGAALGLTPLGGCGTRDRATAGPPRSSVVGIPGINGRVPARKSAP